MQFISFVNFGPSYFRFSQLVAGLLYSNIHFLYRGSFYFAIHGSVQAHDGERVPRITALFHRADYRIGYRTDYTAQVPVPIAAAVFTAPRLLHHHFPRNPIAPRERKGVDEVVLSTVTCTVPYRTVELCRFYVTASIYVTMAIPGKSLHEK